jgi:hypothetical protein
MHLQTYVLDGFTFVISPGEKKSGNGDKPTFRRLIAPISEGVSDMIHAIGDSGCVYDTLQVLSSG